MLTRYSQQNHNIIDKKIAQFLLDNLDKINHLNLNIIANNVNCSKSNITKFAKKLNFRGIKDLLPTLDKNYSYLRMKKVRLSNNFEENDALVWYHNLIQLNIEQLYLLNKNAVYQLTKLILRKKHIILFGKGSNLDVINVFANYLSKMQFHVDYHYDFEVQQKWITKNMENSVCIFFSFSGLHNDIDDLVNQVYNKKCDLVAFTSNYESYLYKKAHISLLTTQNEDVLDNHTSARIAFLYLIMQVINLLNISVQ
ncbi:putative HTH-type transcriptional regulator [Mesomycoplasma conjunctivae]|uniref:HTH rpiR-type domain-containing protein n=2 Tax=Mesomycoplasma conjunctivae TaxID=45361 RepID=C5J774_MESCH|nr:HYPOTHETICAL PROTEIN MCJ_006430 [Mesomycoplasma conjunctivae]VEU66562.1 putative HTH-type transcriptional regulator [Mesomycoplasma conjunctivae]